MPSPTSLRTMDPRSLALLSMTRTPRKRLDIDIGNRVSLFHHREERGNVFSARKSYSSERDGDDAIASFSLRAVECAIRGSKEVAFQCEVRGRAGSDRHCRVQTLRKRHLLRFHSEQHILCNA